MPTGVVLAANAVVGAILVAARPRLAAVVAALPLPIALLLSVYVFGEDAHAA